MDSSYLQIKDQVSSKLSFEIFGPKVKNLRNPDLNLNLETALLKVEIGT
jgi:hypothetical protein